MKDSPLSNESERILLEFEEAYRNFGRDLNELGRRLVEIADNVPNGLVRLRERLPYLSPYAINTILKIGRGAILDSLALSESPGVAALRKCDIADQKRYVSETVQVLIRENGTTTHLCVSVFDLTKPQADQVFGRGLIRSLEQQRQWLESRAPKIKNVAIDQPYSVRRGKIVFHSPCELTLHQLMMLVAQAAE